MKYLLIIINIFIFFTGCVDTYTIKDFNPPENFYNKINEKVKDRTVKVVTNSDSVYEADKLTIRPDSIFFMIDKLQKPDELKSSYKISEIQKINQRTDYKNKIIHVIFLNNGEIISAKNIFEKNDSLFLYDIIPGISREKENISLPTSKVNLVSFNNRWKGTGEGALYIALAGVLFGIRSADITSGDRGAIPPEIAAIGGAIVFAIGGAVVGTATGSYQEYIVNESPHNYYGFTSFRLVGGINYSNLGVSIDKHNSTCSAIVDYSAGISLEWSFNNKLGIKSGILWTSKGGGFDQLVAPSTFAYHRDVFVNFIEIPLLLQYSFRQAPLTPKFYAGPQIGFFRNGRIDNIYDIKEHGSYPFQIYYRAIDSKEINSPEYNVVVGAGFNFQKYSTIDFQYEYGLNKFSNSLFDGEVNNLKLNSFSITLGYGI